MAKLLFGHVFTDIDSSLTRAPVVGDPRNKLGLPIFTLAVDIFKKIKSDNKEKNKYKLLKLVSNSLLGTSASQQCFYRGP